MPLFLIMCNLKYIQEGNKLIKYLVLFLVVVV